MKLTLASLALKKLIKEGQKSTNYEPLEEMSFLIDLKNDTIVVVCTGIKEGERKKITSNPQKMNLTYSSMAEMFFNELEKNIPEGSETMFLEMKIYNLEKKLNLIIYYITKEGEKKKVEQSNNY